MFWLISRQPCGKEQKHLVSAKHNLVCTKFFHDWLAKFWKCGQFTSNCYNSWMLCPIETTFDYSIQIEAKCLHFSQISCRSCNNSTEAASFNSCKQACNKLSAINLHFLREMHNLMLEIKRRNKKQCLKIIMSISLSNNPVSSSIFHTRLSADGGCKLSFPRSVDSWQFYEKVHSRRGSLKPGFGKSFFTCTHKDLQEVDITCTETLRNVCNRNYKICGHGSLVLSHTRSSTSLLSCHNQEGEYSCTDHSVYLLNW